MNSREVRTTLGQLYKKGHRRNRNNQKLPGSPPSSGPIVSGGAVGANPDCPQGGPNNPRVKQKRGRGGEGRGGGSKGEEVPSREPGEGVGRTGKMLNPRK